MKETQRKLLILFFAPIILAAVIIVLYETECLLPGCLNDHPDDNFLAGTMMVLLTMGAIPLALYLFRIPKVHQRLTEDAEKTPLRLFQFGSLRILMLAVPMVLNIWFYYLFAFTTSYFYMAVILLLSMFFVYPSMGRCEAETRND